MQGVDLSDPSYDHKSPSSCMEVGHGCPHRLARERHNFLPQRYQANRFKISMAIFQIKFGSIS